MGLFTVRCTNAECGYRIRKAARYCPKCGHPSPSGRIMCGRCGQEIRASSVFCPYCRAEVASTQRPEFVHDRWARRPEDFATRIEVDDMRGWLIRPLIIEHGTRALLFQEGRFVGELPPGRYDMDGFLQRLTQFMIDNATSVVVVDAGDVPLALENGDLWTADGMEVGTVMQLIVQICSPDAMFRNLLKGRTRLLVDDVECALADEAQMTVAGLVARYDSDQLFPSLDARYEIETRLREHLRTTLQRLGLDLVQLRFIEFAGEGYGQLRRQRSELKRDEERADLAAQRVRLNQRLRETLTQERMNAFESDKDFEEFLRRTEHELGLNQIIREDQMQRLKERFTFERDRDAVLRRLEIQAIQRDDLREQAWKDLIAEERARDERHHRRIEREAAEHRKDVEQARHGLELLERLKDIEQSELDRETERRVRQVEAFSRADAQALVALLNGPAAERVVELEKYRIQRSLTPEQLLAIAAEANPEAARTLATRYAGEGKVSERLLAQLERQIAEQRQITEGYADRIERVMNAALQQMGQVASRRAEAIEPHSTVVVPSGTAAPVVVPPPAASRPRRCRHCGGHLEGGPFCPACGKRQ